MLSELLGTVVPLSSGERFRMAKPTPHHRLRAELPLGGEAKKFFSVLLSPLSSQERGGVWGSAPNNKNFKTP